MYIEPIITVIKMEDLLCAIGACRNNESVQGCSSGQLETTQKPCKS